MMGFYVLIHLLAVHIIYDEINTCVFQFSKYYLV